MGWDGERRPRVCIGLKQFPNMKALNSMATFNPAQIAMRGPNCGALEQTGWRKIRSRFAISLKGERSETFVSEAKAC